LSLCFVKLKDFRDIRICNAITVSEHEEWVIAEILLKAQEPASRHRVRAGLHKGDLPVNLVMARTQEFDGFRTQLQNKVAVMKVIVQEIVADHFAFVAQR